MLDAYNRDALFLLNGIATSHPIFGVVSIFFALWFPYIVIGTVIVYELYSAEKEKRIAVSVIRTLTPALVTLSLVLLFKYIYPAARPFVLDSGIVPLVSVSDPFGSFPSAHAAIFGSLAGAMLAERFHAWKWYFISAFIIGVARIAVGVHWPLDVLAGCVWFCCWISHCTIFRNDRKVSR